MKTSNSGRPIQMLRKVDKGTMAKLSWLCPNVLPTLSVTPITRNGKPARRTSFSSGSRLGKSFSDNVRTDDADAGIVLVIGVGNVPAGGDLFAPDVDKTGSNGTHGDLIDQVPLVACRGVRSQLRQSSDVLVAVKILPKKLVFLHTNGLVAPPRIQKGVESLRPLELVENESVGAQVGDVLGDVQVHAVHNRHDDDQGGGSDDDSKQSQERAQLVAAQCFECYPERLPGSHPHGDASVLLEHSRLYRSLGLTEH